MKRGLVKEFIFGSFFIFLFLILIGIVVAVDCTDSDHTNNLGPDYSFVLVKGTCTDNQGVYTDASTGVDLVRDYYCGPSHYTPDKQFCLSWEFNCSLAGAKYSIDGACTNTPLAGQSSTTSSEQSDTITSTTSPQTNTLIDSQPSTNSNNINEEDSEDNIYEKESEQETGENEDFQESSQVSNPGQTNTASQVVQCNECLKEGKCYSYGYRLNEEFCSSVDNVFIRQFEENSACKNNFECKSNLCIDEKCISEGFLQRIIEWIKRLFGFGAGSEEEVPETTIEEPTAEEVPVTNNLRGNKIMFIFMYDVSGSGQVNIYDLNRNYTRQCPFTAFDPNWLDDGRFYFLDSPTDYNYNKERQLFIYYANCSSPYIKISNVFGAMHEIKFSPDGNNIAYVYQNKVYLHETSSRVTSLKYDAVISTGSNIYWTLDSSKLFFIENANNIANIKSVNRDGTNLKDLGIFSLNGNLTGNLLFSPDNTKLAFVDRVGYTSSLFVMNIDGSNKVLLSTGENMRAIEWSPDSSKILYLDRVPSRIIAYIIDANGNNKRSLGSFYYSENDYNRIYKSWGWCFDSSKLVYSKTTTNIAVYDLNSNTETLNMQGVSAPSFSPDCSRIAYVKRADSAGTAQILIVNSDGTESKVIEDKYLSTLPRELDWY